MAQVAQSVDRNLQKLIEHFVSLCNEAYSNRTNNKAVSWFRPPIVKSEEEGWDGCLQTEEALIAIHKAFNTDEAEQQLKDTFDPESVEGNSADAVVLLLQIDYAAQAERAFRARHQNSARALAHYSSREEGHGRVDGPLYAPSVDYFTSIIRRGS